MRILFVTDLHYQQPWFDWIRDQAPEHDLLCLGGDLLDQNHPAPHHKQVDCVGQWLHELTQPTYLCSGNHDRPWDSARSRWLPADWLHALGDVHLWAHASIVPCGDLRLLIGHYHEPLPHGEADIWLVHTPPAGSSVSRPAHGRDMGDRRLAIELHQRRPALVLCGHQHRPAYWYARLGPTLCVNPGLNWGAPFPNHVVVDTSTGLVHWHSASRPYAAATTLNLRPQLASLA
ncbi:MAG: metallophosphoesterase family protein [Verrucomicrobiota bacterium JB022]|nr:metallophosphoesterase family protein [Verrucomicrobiota bacterium JB022]